MSRARFADLYLLDVQQNIMLFSAKWKVGFMNKTVTEKKRVSSKIVDILKNKWARACAILLVISLCASFFIFGSEDGVAYAAGPVLWGDRGKDKITGVGETEIVRFDDGTADTDPATYSDAAWGNYVLGGINRVDEAHLPTTRPVGISGVGTVDTYTTYYSQNVSVLRYSGGADSNLGISVNSEKIGYVKMNTNLTATGRYLYYSISTKSLSNAVGSYFGTFAVDVGSTSGIIARTETNSAGGGAFVNESNYFTTESNKNSWVTGYEYGCIDLMALTNSESNSVKSVYLFGSSKTKVLLNYLVLSNTAPTKIDVANGNIPDVTGVGGKSGATRTYSNKDGRSGTATMTLSNAAAFNFENLVVDTKYTPYLYYSFEVVGTNSSTAMFHYNKSASTYYYGKKTGNAVSTSVTGCVKISAVTGKTGLVNLASADAAAKGFCFSAGANIKIHYLFLYSGVEITEGSHVIVKNAHSTNTSYTPAYTLSTFSNGSLPQSYTYNNKANSDGTTGVWAPFTFGIDSTLPVRYSWYANTTNELNGAIRMTDNTEATVSNQGVNIKLKPSITEIKKGDTSVETTLKLPNPDKRHNGLYFFCLVVSDSNAATPYTFQSTLSASAIAALEGRWNLVSNFCRLDVADNLVYHKVNQNGVESGIIEEHWLIYGTDYKIKNNADFAENGGYLTYNSYTAPTATAESEYKRNGADICDKGYKIMANYNYTNIEPSVSGVKHLGWILFADTIRNPFGSFSLAGYKNYYRSVYTAASYGYNTKDAHPSWTFALGEAFSLNGLPNSVVHDTTLNFYTKWEISVQTENLEIDIFVDEFGTTFSAVKTPDGYNVLQKPSGNAFINDTIYAAVAPKGDGTTATITSGNGKMQYSVDGMQTWVDVDSSSSKLKDISKKENNMTKVKNWYTQNTVYSFDLVYALEINTDDLLGAFGKLNAEDGGLASEFKIEFRYIAGMAVEGSWFNFTGRAVCGSFNFIPYDYHELT